MSPGKPESMETELMRAELLCRAGVSRLLTLAVSLSVKALVDSGVEAAVCNQLTLQSKLQQFSEHIKLRLCHPQSVDIAVKVTAV